VSQTVEPEIPRGVALAWGVAATPQRGPKREMTVEQIVEAAVEIADTEGLAAVSMAAVAARLGYTPMSLYRYVTAKEDLVLLMQEEATGLPPDDIREAGDWRAQLERIYHEMVRNYMRHPWVMDIPITGSPTTPNSAAWMDAGLSALRDTPLSHDDRLAVLLLVTGHARWTGIVFAGYAKAARDLGADGEAVARREDALFRELVTAEAFPSLRAAIDADVFLSDVDSLAFGVARSLDGVASYIEALAAGQAPPPPSWGQPDDADVAEDKRYREAAKAVREAEKALRDARRNLRRVAAEARDRGR
jgi:AcrR family transcriptional regulator